MVQSRWEYELSFARPSGQYTRALPAGRVVDVRLGTGLSYSAPISGARSTRALLNGLEAKLTQEVNGPVGHLLTAPQGQKDAMVADIRDLKGRVGVVETNGFHGSSESRVRDEYEPKRVGADPPDALIKLRDDAQAAMFAAAGTPVLTSYQDGTAMRESMRRFLHSTIQPVADVALVELREKLEAPDLGNFDFSRSVRFRPIR